MHIIKQLSVSLRHITKQFINLSAFFSFANGGFFEVRMPYFGISRDPNTYGSFDPLRKTFFCW